MEKEITEWRFRKTQSEKMGDLERQFDRSFGGQLLNFGLSPDGSIVLGGILCREACDREAAEPRADEEFGGVGAAA